MKYEILPICWIALLSIGNLNLQAQGEVPDWDMETFLDSAPPNQLYMAAAKYKNTDGTPYFYDGFLYGTIHTKSEHSIPNVGFKYNIFDDIIEYEDDKGRKVNLLPVQLIGFSFMDPASGSTLEFRNGYNIYQKGLNELSFFELLFEGKKVQAIRHYDKDLLSGGAAMNVPGANTGEQTKRFTKEKVVYFLVVGEQATEVKLRRKSIIRAFPGLEEKVKQYMKQEKVTGTSPEDLVKVARFVEVG